jgi:hypothetical protein
MKVNFDSNGVHGMAEAGFNRNLASSQPGRSAFDARNAILILVVGVSARIRRPNNPNKSILQMRQDSTSAFRDFSEPIQTAVHSHPAGRRVMETLPDR